MSTPRILIVEDDDLQYEIYEDALGAYELVRATTGRAALRRIREKAPNLIILDHVLDDGELGLEYCRNQRNSCPTCRLSSCRGCCKCSSNLTLCKALAGRTTASTSQSICTSSRERSRSLCASAAKRKWCAGSRRSNVRSESILRPCSAIPTDRLAGKLRFAGRSMARRNGRMFLHWLASFASPTNNHPRPARADPPRGAQVRSLPQVGKPGERRRIAGRGG